MNAVTLLKRDHRNVEGLFERYRTTSNGKRDIIDEITRALSAHMDAEERELYPVLRESLAEGRSLMDDAVKEHNEARAILAELETADATSFDTDAKVATLRRAIEHHVSEEESDLFPQAQQSLGTRRLDEIATRIERAKLTAPEHPPSSASRNAPGVSVGGVLAAAADRVKNLFSAEEQRKAPRRAARAGRSRKVRSARAKSSASKSDKKARRGRARATAGKTAKGATTRKKIAGRRGRR
jgi:hemerythrin superfamily protein